MRPKHLLDFFFWSYHKLTSVQDNCDEGGDRPDGAHHSHPLHVLPLHELVPGQGGHLQRAHRQVLAHIHGDEACSLNIWKYRKQLSRDLSSPRWAAAGGFLLRQSTSLLSLRTIGLQMLPLWILSFAPPNLILQRILYNGAAGFVWAFILCIIKRQGEEDEEEEGKEKWDFWVGRAISSHPLVSDCLALARPHLLQMLHTAGKSMLRNNTSWRSHLFLNNLIGQ